MCFHKRNHAFQHGIFFKERGENVKKYRIAVYVEQMQRGKIYLKTESENPQDARERIENYLLKAENGFELSPGQFIIDKNQCIEYRIEHILGIEEIVEDQASSGNSIVS
jgi:hypothetical protein